MLLDSLCVEYANQFQTVIKLSMFVGIVCYKGYIEFYAVGWFCSLLLNSFIRWTCK